MAGLDDVVQLPGVPPARGSSSEDWAEVEEYVGSTIPSDLKAFRDAYGPEVISGEPVVFHPRGSSPLIARMRTIRDSSGQPPGTDGNQSTANPRVMESAGCAVSCPA